MRVSKGKQKATQTTTTPFDPQFLQFNNIILGLLTGSLNPEAILTLQGPYGEFYRRTLAAIDPAAQLAAANRYFEQIASPSIQNQLAASGLGRSGAQAEALAQAGTSMALPIQQQAAQQRFSLETLGPQFALQALGLLRPGATEAGTITRTSGGSSMLGPLLTLGTLAASAFLPGLGSIPASAIAGQGATGMTLGGLLSQPWLYGMGALATGYGTYFPT